MRHALLHPGLAFSDYARNVREADVDFLVTDRSQNGWSVRNRIVGRSVLQFGCAGAGTIADGVISQPDVMVFVLQTSPAPHCVHLNGERVETHGIAALAPGSDFVFANHVPHEWISLSVALDRLPPSVTHRLDEQIALRAAALLDAEPGRFAELVRLAANAAKSRRETRNAALIDLPTDNEEEFIHVLKAAVTTSKRSQSERERRDGFHYRGIVRHALAGAPDLGRVHLDDLCRASGVEERTLRRAFSDVFRMPPLRYLKLRRLNQVHAALCDASGRGELVTDVLTRCGVTELGRFATEYRALFGESPSQTIRRSAHRQTARLGPDRGLFQFSNDT